MDEPIIQKVFEDSINNIFNKDSGEGIRVDVDAPTFPWVDLLGLIQPNTASPTTSPTWGVFQPGVNGLSYNTSDILDCVFHVPHDWVLDSESEIHIHWGNNVALLEGDTFSIAPTVVFGTRDGEFGAPVTLAPITYTAGVGGLPIHSHIVTEVPLCRQAPTANQLNCGDVEVDGLFLVSFVVSSISIAGELFIFTADIHHQSTCIGTKNNASPFYGEYP